MDFVIVGGGVYGAGVAWELAKRGAEVLLLEAGEIASGASGGSGSGVCAPTGAIHGNCP